jgi:tripartite-type tricarboxylate transporter receptor subunit TctC
MRKEKRMPNTKSMLVRALGVLLALAILFPLSATAAATGYPSKPVRFIIPMTAGGSTDAFGRLVAANLAERLGVQVIVENKPGGGGVIAGEMVTKSDPDGYTLLFSAMDFAILPAIQKLPYDPMKAFAPIARVISGPNILTIHPSVPANSVKELIALAKQKPGELIFVASGVGATPHMGIELFKMMTGVDIKIVQFKGGSLAVINMLGGHSQATIGGLAQSLAHIKSGKVKVLASCGVNRSSFLPEVPTMAEAGVPGYELDQWFGLFAPAGTPLPVIDTLNRELKAVLASDKVKKQILNAGGEADYIAPAEFSTLIGKEITKWTRIVKEANIKVE